MRRLVTVLLGALIGCGASTGTPAATLSTVQVAADPPRILTPAAINRDTTSATTTTAPGDPGIRWDADFADPTVRWVGDRYVGMATNNPYANVPVFVSYDLVSWYWVGDALPQLPAWGTPGDVWAPSFDRIGDRWVLYVAVREASSGLHCVAVAVADQPTGPYSPVGSGPIVCQRDQRGTIDPEPVRAGGRWWLLHKSEGVAGAHPTRLWISPLADDGRTVTGSPVLLLETSEPWEQPIIENPTMAFEDDQWWLLYSANRWETGSYTVGAARCRTIVGPCTRTGQGPLTSPRDGVAGAGGASLFRDRLGALRVAYHAWPAGQIGYDSGGPGRLLHIGVFSPHADGTAGILGPGGAVRAVTGFGGLTFDPRGVGGPVRGPACPGDATWKGDLGRYRLNGSVLAGTTTPTGRGYWMFATDGGAFAFGDARFYGSMGGRFLAGPIVAATSTPTGRGYWLFGADGGVFSFGDARFYGSMGGRFLVAPIVAATPTRTGRGYWLVARDGGVFSFGDAAFAGSRAGAASYDPVVGGVTWPGGTGYWLLHESANIVAFGGAPRPTVRAPQRAAAAVAMDVCGTDRLRVYYADGVAVTVPVG